MTPSTHLFDRGLDWSVRISLIRFKSSGVEPSRSSRFDLMWFCSIRFDKIQSVESIWSIDSMDSIDSILFRIFCNVGELEICLVSKFQLCTTLGGRKNIEKPKRKISIEKSVFRRFGEVLEDLRPNGRQNQLPRQILLQIDLFWGLYDQKSWIS